jgi:molybdopterin/thiamine biosynthesis adenylyltransferase
MRVLRHLRDGQQHVMLVGFSMPERIGGPPCLLHWQALLLPVLCQGNQSFPGFRPNREATRYRVDRTQVLAGAAPLEWLASENWASAQLVSRGSLPAAITDRHVLLIGGGALGSAIGELLLRAGVRRFTVVDDETLQAGNLCRHTLTLGDLKSNKAASLAKRLGQVSPHATVDAITSTFPPAAVQDIATATACDIVIDCTAEDAVLRELARFPWGDQKRFVSLSLGYAARRLFCFVAEGATFPDAMFQSAIGPWLERERGEAVGAELPREGVGCWHPIFPARADDVWLMAAAAVKHLEKALAGGPAGTKLTVFEQKFEGGAFVGVQRAQDEVRHAG